MVRNRISSSGGGILFIFLLTAVWAEIDLILTKKPNKGFGMSLVDNGDSSGNQIRGIRVESVVPGSAAASAGVIPGDIIVAIGGKYLRNHSANLLSSVVEQIRTLPEGQTIFTIQRYTIQNVKSSQGRRRLSDEATCFSRTTGGNDLSVHRFHCRPATFGLELPPSPGIALTLYVSQNRQFCKKEEAQQEGKMAGTMSGARLVLLVERGGCAFDQKANNAVAAGFRALIVVDFSNGSASGSQGPARMTSRESTQAPNIPLLSLTKEIGMKLVSSYQQAKDEGSRVIIALHSGVQELAKTQRKNHVSRTFAASREDPINLSTDFADGEFTLSVGTPGIADTPPSNMGITLSQDISVCVDGKKLSISYERVALCPHCAGTGGLTAGDTVKCSACEGDGVVRHSHHHSEEVLQSSETTCSQCKGFGEIPLRLCPRCHGERIVKTPASVTLEVLPGTPDGHQLIFNAMGNEYPKRPASNLVVTLEFTIPSNLNLTRNGAELHYGTNITLAEALHGFERDVPMANGSFHHLIRSQVTHHGEQIIIPQGGLPVWREEEYRAGNQTEIGPLVVQVRVVLPETMRDGTKQFLWNFL